MNEVIGVLLSCMATAVVMVIFNLIWGIEP